jgi:hypothetical protein
MGPLVSSTRNPTLSGLLAALTEYQRFKKAGTTGRSPTVIRFIRSKKYAGERSGGPPLLIVRAVLKKFRNFED